MRPVASSAPADFVEFDHWSGPLLDYPPPALNNAPTPSRRPARTKAQRVRSQMATGSATTVEISTSTIEKLVHDCHQASISAMASARSTKRPSAPAPHVTS